MSTNLEVNITLDRKSRYERVEILKSSSSRD
jgi:hypothetical protein